MEKCPLCNTEATVHEFDHGERHRVSCPRCGQYCITRRAIAVLGANAPAHKKNSAILGYWIRQRDESESKTDVDYNSIKLILNEVKLPGPREQADNLIRWIGRTAEMPEDELNILPEHLAPRIGAIDAQGVHYVASHLKKRGYIVYLSATEKQIQQDDTSNFGLTFDGWDRYEELKHSGSAGRIAFMAMQYGDPKHDQIYRDYFKNAVSQTGFELRRLDENLAAGLIDNQLRVEIRNARFVLADLTNQNSGAYWEAGYAEGLGKPVIYLCEKKQFDEFKTHFDTNHHTTIIWDENDLDTAVKNLKNTIRATLPMEAIMIDGQIYSG